MQFKIGEYVVIQSLNISELFFSLAMKELFPMDIGIWETTRNVRYIGLYVRMYITLYVS